MQAATGQRIRGYLAPALTHTERTLELIAEYDFWYTCDLFQDDQPQPVKTRAGRLMSMPYSLEVNDVITYGALSMSPWRYADILKRHFDQLLAEGERSGTVMCIPLHAYLVSQPNRIRAFEEVLNMSPPMRTTSGSPPRWRSPAIIVTTAGTRPKPTSPGVAWRSAALGSRQRRAAMPLPDDYLLYPHRAYGMDQSLYGWTPAPRRAPVAWPDGKVLAALVVVPLEFHRLDPEGKPFKAPGAMQTPYPDLRHYTTRDYGLRVGLFRILDALAEAGIRATVPVNAVLLDRIKPAIEAIHNAGHEIAAHGWEADAIHWSGLPRDEEAARFGAVRRAFDGAGRRRAPG